MNPDKDKYPFITNQGMWLVISILLFAAIVLVILGD
jgi:hypothetical protein